MNNPIKANYFDGLSSIKKNVSLSYDESINKLLFNTSSGDFFVWNLTDLVFDDLGGVLEIRNKNNLDEILRIDDEDFALQFYLLMKKNKRVDIHTTFKKMGFIKIAIISFFVFLSFAFIYLIIIPRLAISSVNLFPESFDNSMGDLFMTSFIDESMIDYKKSKHLQNFSDELSLFNEKPLNYTVLKSDELNAFALPNGHNIFYTGILDVISNEEQLVALISHEASHVNNRHSMKMLARNLASYIVISVVISDVNGIMSLLADNVHTLHSLSYSRAFEQEADEEGLKIIISNNINPYGMIELFEKFEEIETDFILPKIMSTHPMTKDRKDNIEKIILESNYIEKKNPRLSTLFEILKSEK